MAGVFSHNERARAVAGLVGSGRVLIYQDLLPTVDGARCAAREYLVLTEDLRKTLYGIDESQLTEVMTEMVHAHGRPLIADVRDHFQEGRISEETLNRYEAEFAATSFVQVES
jgi:defect-in-organelle-trafficking protein DotB